MQTRITEKVGLYEKERKSKPQQGFIPWYKPFVRPTFGSLRNYISLLNRFILLLFFKFKLSLWISDAGRKKI